jgi:hypothetical protein
MIEKKQWQTVTQPVIKGGKYGLLEQDGNTNHYRLTYRDTTTNELVCLLWSAEEINAASWYHPTRVEIKKESDTTTKTQDLTNPKVIEWKELKTHAELVNERAQETANTIIAAYAQARENAPLNIYVNVIENEAVRKRLKEDMEIFGKTEREATDWMNNTIKPAIIEKWFSTNSISGANLLIAIRIQKEFNLPESAAWNYRFTISPKQEDLISLGKSYTQIDALAQWYIDIITSQIADDIAKAYLTVINSDVTKLWSSVNVNELGQFDDTIERITSQIQWIYDSDNYNILLNIRNIIHTKLRDLKLHCDIGHAIDCMKKNNERIASHKIPIRVQSIK